MPEDQALPLPFAPPRYCLRCQESLGAKPPCRRCGLQFDPENAATFRGQRMMLRWKFWFPGFCLAVASGVISYAIVATTGEMGAALFISVPLSFGAILGYATRASIWWILALLAVGIPSVIMGLLAVDMSGFFCGLTLGAIFFLPALVGVTLGWLLRVFLKLSRWDQRYYLPLVFFVLLPYGSEAVESYFPRREEIATVQTGLTIDATPEEVWQSLMFYEEVKHEPPWLLHLALPKPVGSEGSKQAEGNLVRCVYDRGHIVKRISRRADKRLLAFEVVEQNLHFEHDVRLRDGSFRLIPLAGGRTHLRLTTGYERLLRPQRLWEPMEREVIHTLHGHVLEGIRQHIVDCR